MGIETSADHGGAESSFTSAIIAIEELAKVDPSVSVMCDVHNTLVNTVIRKYGTPEQQEKWLPQLSTSKVRRQTLAYKFGPSLTSSQRAAWQLLLVRGRLWFGCVCPPDPCKERRRYLDYQWLQDVDHKFV